MMLRREVPAPFIVGYHRFAVTDMVDGHPLASGDQAVADADQESFEACWTD